MPGLAMGVLAGIWMAAAEAGTPEQWAGTIDDISSGIVSIRIDRTRPFDTTWYANSQATGFVVDAERGILLTNRHVVSPGPVVAEALFLNSEEIAIEAIYRDPVHDFGFFRFDPADLRFIAPAELVLAPRVAEVGTEIRVIGNDAGEKLSILGGTIARLDRPAPSYGANTFNDFNTFYLQAASGTSGGSSGSPVLGVDGRVLALNAGSNTRAASSFYLPLDRVVRALELIRAGEPVTRGTLATTFARRTYDEIRRLGLADGTEARFRDAFPAATGMLVVSDTVPGGPVDGKLQPGDVLVSVEGAPIADFVSLEAILDDAVGQAVELQVERRGETLTVAATVADLHAITPSSFLEFGGGLLHDLSYQQARNHHLPLEGVYVANGGYVLDRAGVPYQSVITELAGQPTPNLDALQSVLAGLKDGERATVRWFSLTRPERSEVRSVLVDRDWFPTRRCARDGGDWPCVAVAGPAERAPASSGSTDFARADDKRARAVVPSLVTIDFDIPYTIDGVRGARYRGLGLIVDADAGLVVTDRNTVPLTLGDVALTFGSTLEVPATVVALHPIHNLALLRYDPSLLGDTPVRSATLSSRRLEPGDDTWFVGRKMDEQLVVRGTEVTEERAMMLGVPSRPRFRELNLDVLEIGASLDSGGGVLVDKKGRVEALWASFSYDGDGRAKETHAAVRSEILADFVAAFDGGDPTFRNLEVELLHLPLSDARNLGLSDDWIATMSDADDSRRVLQVRRLTANSPAAEVLLTGDLLLAIDGVPVSRFRQVELAVAAGESPTLSIFRGSEVQEVTITPRALSGRGAKRMVFWAGCFLQETPLAAAQQRMTPREGVYVDLRFRGSPSMRYGLARNSRILQVDGTDTPDLDAFLALVDDLEDRTSIRLTTVDLSGRTQVVTLKLDLTWWPTRELQFGDDGWVRQER